MSSSASDPGKGATPSLAGRIEALERQTAALTAALAQGQRVRSVITLLLVVFVGLTITMFYLRMQELRNPAYLEELLAVAQTKMEPRREQLFNEAKILYDAAGPKVREAFVAQVEKDSPKYLDTIEIERVKLKQNLEDRLRAIVADRVDKSVRQHEQLLRREFPLADNQLTQERMIDNVGKALEQVADKYYAKELNQKIVGLYDNWDAFPPAESDPGELPLEDQLIGALLELLKVKLKNTEAVLTE